MLHHSPTRSKPSATGQFASSNEVTLMTEVYVFPGGRHEQTRLTLVTSVVTLGATRQSRPLRRRAGSLSATGPVGIGRVRGRHYDVAPVKEALAYVDKGRAKGKVVVKMR